MSTKVELEEDLESALDAMEEALNVLDPEEGDPDPEGAVDILSEALGLDDDPDE